MIMLAYNTRQDRPDSIVGKCRSNLRSCSSKVREIYCDDLESSTQRYDKEADRIDFIAKRAFSKVVEAESAHRVKTQYDTMDVAMPEFTALPLVQCVRASGTVYSQPICTNVDGSHTIVEGLPIDALSREKIDANGKKLLEEHAEVLAQT